MSAIETRTSEDEIEITLFHSKDEKYTLARLVGIGGGNGIECEIFEGNRPFELGGQALRMGPCELITLAQAFLKEASERARDLECA